jgi:methylated-DNA-[protein]-cysteine S-methyltransferase
MTYYTIVESPIDELTLVSNGRELTALHMGEVRVGSDWVRDDDAEPFARVREQLRRYFRGELTSFEVPIALKGTEFQRQVWEELCRIPYGQTISYGELARRIGNPNAMRAVGLANGRNPIGIIVPCHRVIGANGTLTGYGGGLPRKKLLLELEAGSLFAGLESR